MNHELMERLLASPRLPSLPSVAIQVIDLVQQPDVNIKQIADTVQHDPALSTRILKTVNSSFYGQSQPISTISHALVVLGLNSVKTLALGFSLVNNLKHTGGKSFDHMAFWKRSLYAATAARVLAQKVMPGRQEEAFLGGLLQDLGMLAMSQTLDEQYTQLLIEVGDNHRQLARRERQAFDLDHAQVGQVLAQRWSLPTLLATAIGRHETPEQVDDETPDVMMIRCIALGGRVADVFICQNVGEAIERYYADIERWFGLSSAEAGPMLRIIHGQTNEMRHLLNLPVDELDNPDEILARANEALLQISLQTQKQTSELERENRKLSKQILTDSLTGTANRGRFNSFIEEQFDRVFDAGGTVSLLFLDADHFKQFNDIYGHQTGDRVLVQLAALLKDCVPDTALVARYGGEEFALILPGFDRRSAAMLADQIRLRIADTPVYSDDGQALEITASIGVATHDGTFFQQVQQFIKAADKAVYAAKDAGRNAVRIFSPRRKAPASTPMA